MSGQHRAHDDATTLCPRTASGEPDPFPVVGIGASAGGFEAFKKLFEALPPDSGMAFILIQHLDPTHQSLMVELLARHFLEGYSRENGSRVRALSERALDLLAGKVPGEEAVHIALVP